MNRSVAVASAAGIVLSLLSATASAEEGKESEQHGDEAESEEPGFEAGVEVLTGFGKVDAVNLAPPTSLGSLSYVKESTQAVVVTPILSLGFPVTKHLRLGGRLPFVIGQLTPDNDKSRGAANWGNVELEAEYERELSHTIGLQFALGLALPTARGDELPEQETLDKLGNTAPSQSYDKFSINHAAELAHGSENSALFESKRFGIVPKVGLPMHFGKEKIEPYVKVENLIATFADAPAPVIVELVAGTRLAYALTSWFDAGVRVWGNFTLTAHEGRDLNIGVVEPEVRFRYHALHATVGGIIPFVGEPTHPEFGGVRTGLLFAF